MDASIVSIQSVFSDGLHILVDYLEVHFREVAHLYRLVEEFFQTALSRQSLVDLFPRTVFVGIHFTFSILCATALSIHKALGTVDDRTDTSGHIQIALCTCVTALLGKCHTVMSSVIQSVACSNNRLSSQICNCLNTKAAGNHYYILCSFRNQIL